MTSISESRTLAPYFREATSIWNTLVLIIALGGARFREFGKEVTSFYTEGATYLIDTPAKETHECTEGTEGRTEACRLVVSRM